MTEDAGLRVVLATDPVTVNIGIMTVSVPLPGANGWDVHGDHWRQVTDAVLAVLRAVQLDEANRTPVVEALRAAMTFDHPEVDDDGIPTPYTFTATVVRDDDGDPVIPIRERMRERFPPGTVVVVTKEPTTRG